MRWIPIWQVPSNSNNWLNRNFINGWTFFENWVIKALVNVNLWEDFVREVTNGHLISSQLITSHHITSHLISSHFISLFVLSIYSAFIRSFFRCFSIFYIFGMRSVRNCSLLFWKVSKNSSNDNNNNQKLPSQNIKPEEYQEQLVFLYKLYFSLLIVSFSLFLLFFWVEKRF
jgi:hypothetical protein